MPRETRSKRNPWKLLWFPGIIACAGAAVFFLAWQNVSRSAIGGDASTLSAGQKKIYAAYGGSASCRKCHSGEYADWENSHHALAERDPGPADAPAFIPARSFTFGTQKTSVLANDGRFELVTAGLSGSNETFAVERILADTPLRQMLIPFPHGRLQATEVAWDPRSNQWFDVYGQEDRKPGEWGHWTGRGMNWNSMCGACHNTLLQKNYDPATDSYHTTWVEHGVGCEACHGPMKAHNVWQEAHKGQSQPDPTIHKLSRDQMVDTCAACHSRRAEITDEPEPGASYWDHYLLSMVDDSDAFYPDGQIHDEDYEFTAFLGSRMYNRGVRCMDCHNPHTMKTRLPGNFLCLSCHFPGATKAPPIDPVSHSHHQVFGYNAKGVLTNTDLSLYHPDDVKQSGGECINCHMPQTVYMQRHWRHDHGFTIPDPLLTKEFDIPNACNRCHTDKTTDWSLGYVENWYGTNMNRPYRRRAEILAGARRGSSDSVKPLIAMLQTDEFPYWRAAAANLLQPWINQPEVASALIGELSNTNPLVRQMVVQTLGPLVAAGNDEATAALRPMLQDQSRNVRIVAAQELVATLDTNSPAGVEYLHFLAYTADQPVGQLQAGNFELTHGDTAGALSHFKTAVDWDPTSGDIRHELAVVLSQAGESQEAVTQMEKAVELAPDNADLHFSLALAFNEAGETQRVIPELERAVALNPHHARAWYNLGLARNAQGDAVGAMDALVRAEQADPQDPQIPYARATILAREGNLTAALAAARRALDIDPNFTPATDLIRQISAQ